MADSCEVALIRFSGPQISRGIIQRHNKWAAQLLAEQSFFFLSVTESIELSNQFHLICSDIFSSKQFFS